MFGELALRILDDDEEDLFNLKCGAEGYDLDDEEYSTDSTDSVSSDESSTDCDAFDFEAVCRLLLLADAANRQVKDTAGVVLTHLFVEQVNNAQAARLGHLLQSTSAWTTVQHLHLVVGGLTNLTTRSKLMRPSPSLAPLLAYFRQAQSGLRSVKLSASACSLPWLMSATPMTPISDVFLSSLQHHSQLQELELSHVTVTCSALVAYLQSSDTCIDTLQMHYCTIQDPTNVSPRGPAQATTQCSVRRLDCTVTNGSFLDQLLPLLASNVQHLRVAMGDCTMYTRIPTIHRPTVVAARAIQQLLESSSLKSLELCRFEDVATVTHESILWELVRGLSTAPCLSHFTLDSCTLNAQSTAHLQNALCRAPHLDSLTLTGRTTVTDPQLVTHVLLARSTGRTLRHVSLNSFHGLHIDYDALLGALTRTTLHRLDLGLVSSRTACDALIRHGPHVSLCELSFDVCVTTDQIQHCHVDQLVAALSRNCSLLVIDCQPNTWNASRRGPSASRSWQRTMEHVCSRNAFLKHLSAIPIDSSFRVHGTDTERASMDDGVWPTLIAAVDQQVDASRAAIFDMVRIMSGRGLIR